MNDYTGRVSDEFNTEPRGYTVGATDASRTDDKSSEEIKADIEQTRSEMSQKINQIQERLDPTRLKEQAQETVRSAVSDSTDALVNYVRGNAGEFGYSVVDTIKRNPVPAALVGIGLGWMIFKSFSSPSSDGSDYEEEYYRERYNNRRSGAGYPQSTRYGNEYGTDAGDQSRYSYEAGGARGAQYQGSSRYSAPTGYYRDDAEDQNEQSRVGQASQYVQDKASDVLGQARDTAGQVTGQVQETAQQAGQYVQEKASDVLGQARDTAGQVTEQVQETAQQAGQYVQEKVGQVREQASQLGEQAQQTLQGTGRQVQRTVENNPVPFGIAALVAGVLIGLALPETQTENQVMGEKRDQLLDNAQSVAQDVKQRVQTIVDEKLPEVKQTAQKVAEDLKQTGKVAADDIKQTLKDAGESAKQNVNELAQVGKDAAKDVAQTGKDAAQDAAQSVDSKTATISSSSASYSGSTAGATSLTGAGTNVSEAPEEEGSTRNARM
jgi:hypothetical protein